MRKLIMQLGLAAAILALLGAACVPPVEPPYEPPDNTTTTWIDTADPQPATPERFVFGASISWQAAGYAEGDGRTWSLNPGKGLENIYNEVWAKQMENPTVVHLADVSTNSAGTWDGRDGWSADDEWYWWQAITWTQPGTCLVIALPHLTTDAEVANPGVLTHVEAARAWFARAQQEASWVNLVIADWRVWAGEGAIGPDGIHIVAGPEAADRWIGMLNDAEIRCVTG